MSDLSPTEIGGRRALIADTECTGIENPSIVQFAYLEVDPSTTVGGLFLLEHKENHEYMGVCELRRPTRAMTLGALAVHGILPAYYEDAPLFSWAEDMGPDVLLIGHNVDYDWGAFGRPPVPRICTLAMARRIWPDLDSHSLGALVYHVNGISEETREIVHGAHNAGADCAMTARVFFAMLKARPELNSWQKVWEFSEDARIPRKWTFGKFDGQPIGAEDAGYRGWFHRTCADREDYQQYCIAFEMHKAGRLHP